MAFSVHISSDHNHISRYKFNIFKLNGLSRRDKISFSAMPSPNIPSQFCKKNYQINYNEQARSGLLWQNALPKHPRFNNNVKQDLPLRDSQMGAL